MTTENDPSRFRQAGRNTAGDVDYRRLMELYIEESPGTSVEKLENFTKYASRQTISRFLALYEIFKRALNVQGDIIECGVNWGFGLMAFAQFSAALEPVNLQRRIIGFDTFAGFSAISAADQAGEKFSREVKPGGLAANSYDDLRRCVGLFDANRFIGHIEKVALVRGDATTTMAAHLAENPHTVVSILHLDFDLYEPTKAAIEAFVPRMPAGGIIIFDELNNRTWPGETTAVIDTLGLSRLRIERFPFEPHVSFAVLGT